MHGLTELRTEPQNFTACSRNYKLLKPTQQSSPILFIFQSMQFSNQATALMYWAKDWTQKPCCVKVLPVSESDWQWQAEINTQPRPLCPSNGNQFSSLCPLWIEVYSLPVHLNFLNMANHYSLHWSHAQQIGTAVYFGPKPILQNKIHGHWDFAILYPPTLWFYDWHNNEKNINNSRHGNVSDSVLKCYHLCNLNALPLMILMCNVLI